MSTRSIFFRLEAGGWRLEAGGWRLEAGGWTALWSALLQSSFFVQPSSLQRCCRLFIPLMACRSPL
ncbi:hypothetical protein DNK44_02250 [Pseudomonas dryadis]|uniref:Uncharacterized protein n=1 Tax=Phytopseudomonas dryadis TaxID=2487520 RepID=A0A4Q9R8R5_9GAMM|nr:hypothetical protein DNK44_02250 [Pseudomonas dryadis]